MYAMLAVPVVRSCASQAQAPEAPGAQAEQKVIAEQLAAGELH